jgi:secreted PhoX family phosphatase
MEGRDLLNDDEASVNPSLNPTYQAILAARLSRRGFLAGSAAGLTALAAERLAPRGQAEAQIALPFPPVTASKEDKLLLPSGYKHTVLLRWGDPIFPNGPKFDPRAQTARKQERQFGSDNDFIGCMPLPRVSITRTPSPS